MAISTFVTLPHICYKLTVDKVHRAVFADVTPILIRCRHQVIYNTVPCRQATDGAVDLGSWQHGGKLGFFCCLFCEEKPWPCTLRAVHRHTERAGDHAC